MVLADPGTEAPVAALSRHEARAVRALAKGEASRDLIRAAGVAPHPSRRLGTSTPETNFAHLMAVLDEARGSNGGRAKAARSLEARLDELALKVQGLHASMPSMEKMAIVDSPQQASHIVQAALA